jgi:hypothetical protein
MDDFLWAVVDEEKVTYLPIPATQMFSELFFCKGIRQNLLSFPTVNTAVDILVKESLHRLFRLVKSLFFA